MGTPQWARAVLSVSLQNRLDAPIHLTFDLNGDSQIEVRLTAKRRDLPTDPENVLRWAAAITGAVAWFLTYPPPIRRKQFIVDLRKPTASWVSPQYSKPIKTLIRQTLGKEHIALAETVLLPAKSREDLSKGLFATEIVALHSRLRARLRIRFLASVKRISATALGPIVEDLVVRLRLCLAYMQQYARHRPGGATRDMPFTSWIGITGAVAHYIVQGDMLPKPNPSPELKVILEEMVKKTGAIKLTAEGYKDLAAYIAARSLKGIPDLRRFKPVAPLVRDHPDFGSVDSFYSTYVRPYSRKLGPRLPFFADLLKPYLLGRPGALAATLRL